MLKRVPLIYDPPRGYCVNLPTYTILAGTFLPVQKGLIHRDGPFPNAEPADVLALKPTVIVSTPMEDCLLDDGQLCRMSIAKKYRGHPLFDTADYQPPLLHEFHPIELNPPKDASVFQRIAQALHITK